MEKRSRWKQDSAGLCGEVGAFPKGPGGTFKGVKQGSDSFAPEEEMILESTSRTLRPTVAHAGEKENDFLLPKESPFAPNLPLGLALAGNPGAPLAAFQLTAACFSQGSPAPHRGPTAAAAKAIGFLFTL